MSDIRPFNHLPPYLFKICSAIMLSSTPNFTITLFTKPYVPYSSLRSVAYVQRMHLYTSNLRPTFHYFVSIAWIWLNNCYYMFKYNQQGATLYNLFFFSAKCSTRFRRFLRPSSGAQNCIYRIGHFVKPLLLLASVVASSSKVPSDVYTVLNSWWLAEEPPETCRAFHRNK